jgi:hypothetical protein
LRAGALFDLFSKLFVAECPAKATRDDLETKLMQIIAPVSLVALPGRVLPPARSRTREEATAFVLTDLHLPAVKSASRHKRQ